jgi:hypothetical protein
LDNDIDASDTRNWNVGKGWLPIGRLDGNFNGNGYSVTNLFIDRPDGNNIGFAGEVSQSGILEQLQIVSCDISGGNKTGLIAGENNGIIRFCTSDGIVTGNDFSGNLVGVNNSSVYNCSSSGNTYGDYQVGGLIGRMQYGAVMNSFSTSVVYGNTDVGGLIGGAAGSVTNCYASGDINGDINIGGLIGFNIFAVNNCFSTGVVTGSTDQGGLIGKNAGGRVTSSFWDVDSSNLTYSSGGVGISTQEMQNPDFFINRGWNFDFIWTMSNQCPFIQINESFKPSDNDNNGCLDIESLSDLRWLSESGYDMSSNFELKCNINAEESKNWNSGVGFFPIGSAWPGFIGIFDGNGHEIINLVGLRTKQNHVGLFGCVGTKAIIKDLAVTDCRFTGDYYTGAIAGKSAGLISNCYSTGSVECNRYCGGIVGLLSTGRNINCFSTCTTTGGGIVGAGTGTTISCFWDKETSGIKTSAGGTGLNTAQMQTRQTFLDAGWDFDSTWALTGGLNDGYPFFKSQYEQDSQTIPLKKGWNMISSRIIPEIDSSDAVFAGISDNLFLAKNSRGKLILPDYGINQIPIFDIKEGLLLHMTGADTLTIEGFKVLGDTEIDLRKGWNMIPYFCENERDIDSLLSEINRNIFLIKNGKGSIYLPDYGIDQIETLKPGEGYLIFMKNDDVLVYPGE